MRKHRFLSSFVIFVAGFALSAIVDGRRLASLAQGTLSNQGAQEIVSQITRQPSTSQKWEYRVVAKYNPDRGNMDFELNRLGEQGFELYSVTQSNSDIGFYLAIVLRRPK
jgi:hypothetical protein